MDKQVELAVMGLFLFNLLTLTIAIAAFMRT